MALYSRSVTMSIFSWSRVKPLSASLPPNGAKGWLVLRGGPTLASVSPKGLRRMLTRLSLKLPTGLMKPRKAANLSPKRPARMGEKIMEMTMAAPTAMRMGKSGANVSAHHVCHGGASSLVGSGGVGRSLVGSWSRCSVLLISRGTVSILRCTISVLRCAVCVLRSGVFLLGCSVLGSRRSIHRCLLGGSVRVSSWGVVGGGRRCSISCRWCCRCCRSSVIGRRCCRCGIVGGGCCCVVVVVVVVVVMVVAAGAICCCQGQGGREDQESHVEKSLSLSCRSESSNKSL